MKVRRLNESDIQRIVKRVLTEQEKNNKGLKTLLSWCSEKHKDDNYCTPEEKKWKSMNDRGYCPKGNWIYTLNNDKFDYYSKENKLISSDSNVTPKDDGSTAVNELSELSRYVKSKLNKTKSKKISGKWVFSSSSGTSTVKDGKVVPSGPENNHLYFYDDKGNFIGTIND